MRWIALIVALCITPSTGEEIVIGMDSAYEEESSGAFKEEYSVAELRDKIEGFTTMRNGGMTLLLGGASLGTVGALVLFDGLRRYNRATIVEENSYQDPTYDGYYAGPEEELGMVEATLGIYALMFGIPITIAGTVVTSIGARKLGEYEHRLRNAQGRLGLRIGLGSAAVVYEFR